MQICICGVCGAVSCSMLQPPFDLFPTPHFLPQQSFHIRPSHWMLPDFQKVLFVIEVLWLGLVLTPLPRLLPRLLVERIWVELYTRSLWRVTFVPWRCRVSGTFFFNLIFTGIATICTQVPRLHRLVEEIPDSFLINLKVAHLQNNDVRACCDYLETRGLMKQCSSQNSESLQTGGIRIAFPWKQWILRTWTVMLAPFSRLAAIRFINSLPNLGICQRIARWHSMFVSYYTLNVSFVLLKVLPPAEVI